MNKMLKTMEKISLIGITTLMVVLIAIVGISVINYIFPDPDWKYYSEHPIIDGHLYLHPLDPILGRRDIYLGHEEILTLCRSENPTYGGYKLRCEEDFVGCGAVNCECWVIGVEEGYAT